MRSKYFDSIIILSQLLVLGYTSYKLFFESSNLNQTTSTQLAYIEQKSATVKRRSSGLLTWNNISTKDPIYNGDRIFTHNHSSAIIRFSDSSKIILKENALIKIEKKDNQTLNLDIKKGGVVIDGINNMQIKVGDIKISSNSKESKLSIQSDGKNSKISLLAGKATLQNSKGSQKIDKNSAITLNEKGDITQIQKISIALQTPHAGETHYIDSKHGVKFKWKLLANERPFQIIISKNSLFKTNNHVVNVSKNHQYLNNMQPGSYYWKAVNRNGDDISITETFTVILMASPKIIAPTQNQRFIINEVLEKEAVQNITLKWEGASAQAVHIDLNSSSNKKKIKIETSNKLEILDSLPIGSYSVRVGSTFNDTVKWSSIQNFKIQLNPLPTPPTILFPLPDSIHFGRKIHLRFEEKVGLSYKLKILSNHDEIASDEFEDANYYFKAPNYGQFCLHLASIDEYDRSSKTNQKSCFTLIPKAPLLKNLPSEFFYSDNFKQIDLEWDEIDNLKYQIQISHDSKFNRIIMDKTVNENEFSWKKPTPALYYIRIRSIGEKATSPFSKPIRIKIKNLPKLEAPKLIPGEIFELGYHHIKRWWDYIIDSAHADQFKTVIKWNSIALAKEYYLEIFEDSKGKHRILNTSTEKSSYRWESALPGTYYWRLSFKDRFGRKSPTSKLVMMKIAPSKKWVIATARKKKLTTKNWRLSLGMAPTSINYHLSGYPYIINIDGGSITSIEGSLAYQLTHKILLKNKSTLLLGPVLKGNLSIIRNRFYATYLIPIQNSFLLKLGAGIRSLLISHSDPISITKFNELAAITLQYGKKVKHELNLEVGISLLSGSYQLIIPLKRNWYGQIGLSYYSENFSYDDNEVDISSLSLILGGGLQF